MLKSHWPLWLYRFWSLHDYGSFTSLCIMSILYATSYVHCTWHRSCGSGFILSVFQENIWQWEVCLVCVESYYNDAGLPPAHGPGYEVYHILMKGASLTNEKCVTQLLVHVSCDLVSLLYTKSVSHPSLSDVPSSLWQRVHMPVILRKLLCTLQPYTHLDRRKRCTHVHLYIQQTQTSD